MMPDELNMGGAGRSGLVAELDAIVAAQHVYLFELLVRIPAFDEQREWFVDGATSMSMWLSSRYRVSRATASEWVRVSHALGSLPHVGQGFFDGELSWDQLRAITRVATADTDLEWATQGPLMDPTQIRATRPAPSDTDVVDVYAERSVRWRFREQRPVMEMFVSMPDAEGAALATAIMRRANQYGPDPITGRFESFEARCADALAQIASEALSADPDPDRATVVVHTNLETLLTGDGSATLDAGVAVSQQTLWRLTCDARLQLALTDPDGTVVGVGRTTRTIPAWLRRLVLARDGGCQFPGCGRKRWVDVHHVIHWADGGPTDLDNLIALCKAHHRLIHEHGWTLHGNPNQSVWWVTPFGDRFEPKAPPDTLRGWRTYLGNIPDIMAPPIMVATTIVNGPPPRDTS